MAGGEPLESSQVDGSPPASEGEGPSERPDRAAEIRDVSFPISVRGYDRDAVDAYVSRVQGVVAELEATRSPQAVIRHALADIGERTKGVLERAGETAEDITLAAREDAEASVARAEGKAKELLAKAKAEAEATVAQAQKEAREHRQQTDEEIAALRAEAEARMRELSADTEAIREERTRLVDDIRELAARVDEVAGAADQRIPPPRNGDQAQESAVEDETKDAATR
ncbi:MAG TPA: DivIVA domain-containing protein [Gaiellaceae bacterium]|nr:DivIVA domain-containing protein [Gaiellaceae bacterium]